MNDFMLKSFYYEKGEKFVNTGCTKGRDKREKNKKKISAKKVQNIYE